MQNNIRVGIFGDLVGIPGRSIFAKHLPSLKSDLKLDAVIVNGENSANDGKGITPKIMGFLKEIGVSVVTTGNHIWQKKEIQQYIAVNNDLLRPVNFPASCPGLGLTTITCGSNATVGIVNVQGRTFMREQLGCPFKALETAISFLKTKTKTIIVDMHAETTSEKAAMAFFLDGKISCLVGTHTHVQTADERILPNGTAFITDLGCACCINSIIGVKKGCIINNFITQMPNKFEVETEGPIQLCGIYVDIDTLTGKALNIQRIRIIDPSVDLIKD